MRGGALPPALLAAALGLALAFAPRRAMAWSLPVFAITALLGSFAPFGSAWTDGLFLGCWASVVLCAVAVHVPHGLGEKPALALAVNAGVWCGAVISVAGQPLDLVKALPWALLCLPASWVVVRKMQIGVKVVASWLIAVAVLVAMIPLTPTPGYVSDHME